MAQQPRYRQVEGGQASREAEVDRVLEENFATDAAERSRLVLSQIDSLAASGQDKAYPISEDFLEKQLTYPLTDEARQRITDMLVERRRATTELVDTEYERMMGSATPVRDPFPSDMAVDMLEAPYRAAPAPRRTPR